MRTVFLRVEGSGARRAISEYLVWHGLNKSGTGGALPPLRRRGGFHLMFATLTDHSLLCCPRFGWLVCTGRVWLCQLLWDWTACHSKTRKGCVAYSPSNFLCNQTRHQISSFLPTGSYCVNIQSVPYYLLSCRNQFECRIGRQNEVAWVTTFSGLLYDLEKMTRDFIRDSEHYCGWALRQYKNK